MEDEVPEHPNVPSPVAVVLALSFVVVAGLLGGAIGWGLALTACTGACTAWAALGALVGAALTTAGTGVVAVLVLRAQAEWEKHPAQVDENVRRRKPSA